MPGQEFKLEVNPHTTPLGPGDQGASQRFGLELQPRWCGRLVYRIRAFPYHPLLAHPHEMGAMVWL